MSYYSRRGSILPWILVLVLAVLMLAFVVSQDNTAGRADSLVRRGQDSAFQPPPPPHHPEQAAPVGQSPSGSGRPLGIYDRTGPNNSVMVPLDLVAGEVIVGQSWGFERASGGCQAFLISGPITGGVTIIDGEWTVYKDQVVSAEWANRLLQEAVDKQRNLYGCAVSNVTRLG